MSTNELLRGSFKGNLGYHTYTRLTCIHDQRLPLQHRSKTSSLLWALDVYDKLTFLKGSESEVWKVASQFGVAGRLLQLAVRHGGVKLMVWSRGKTDFLCVLLESSRTR